MQAEKQHEAEHQGKDKIVEELVKRNDFPVPDSMLDQQIDLRLERGLRALAAQGMTTEAHEEDGFRAVCGRSAGGCPARGEGLIDPGADCRQREDRGQRRGAGARSGRSWRCKSKQPIEQVRARLTEDGGLDRIRHRIRNEKTLGFSLPQVRIGRTAFPLPTLTGFREEVWAVLKELRKCLCPW